MRPVDDATLRIPLVLTVELDRIAATQRSNTTRQVDVVCHQHCMSGWQANDEPLVASAVVVIREDFRDLAATADLNVAPMILDGGRQCLVRTFDDCVTAAASSSIMLSRQESALRRVIYGRERERYCDYPLHWADTMSRTGATRQRHGACGV
jgi:hypothetical protein